MIRCSSSTSRIADTDYTRAARVSKQNAHGGFTLRSLQLLDYALTDLEAQAPVIISVTPLVLPDTGGDVTITGSPFVIGFGCVVTLFSGLVASTCQVVNAVEMVARFPSGNSPFVVTRLTVVHNGITFVSNTCPRSLMSLCIVCPAGFAVTNTSGVCEPVAMPPLTQGLVGFYTAATWNPVSNVWADASGFGNHMTEMGGSSISVARPVGAPAYVHGASTAWMKFPAGILPSAQYTLFYVARYNGPTRRRILQGVALDWFSGFHGDKAGVASHGNGTCYYVSSSVDLHGSDWVVGSDRSDSFRSNGVDRTTNAANACQAFDRLAINTGLISGETSDFAIQSILVYNVKLSDADVQRVEAWLNRAQPAFTPANLQASL